MSATDGHISRTDTNTSDVYDHAITLIDTTAPNEPTDNDDASRTLSKKDTRWRDVARNPTKAGVRERLARDKYARYQEGRQSYEEQPERGRPSVESEQISEVEAATAEPGRVSTTSRVQETDFAARERSEERGRPQSAQQDQPRPSSKDTKPPRTPKTKHHKEDHDFDILYENQRGWFICGIPLYSHSSLLNFDPAPWLTKDLKDSPVNITNAQVPDPTWEWAWKSWYVDMSYDVDEEGWQYSFSFSSRFSWHGTHPWFHSFVRRRRWLRKRVKKHHTHLDDKPSNMGQAHLLTSDYFTIHPKRNRSRSTDGNTNGRSSYIGTITSATAEREIIAPEDINNIPTLLKALKAATVDREKIEAVRRFVTQGGEELAYLKDSIPEIMSFLIFQNSRRQLLSYLNSAAEEASSSSSAEPDKSSEESRRRRSENLSSAASEAENQIDGLEYWSDRKHILSTTDDDLEDTSTDEKKTRPSTAVSKESNVSKDVQETRHENPMEGDQIRGIPEAADVGVDPTHRLVHQGHMPAPAGSGGGGDGADDDDDERNDLEKEKGSEEGEEKEEVEVKEQQPQNQQLPRDAVKLDD